MVQKQKAQHNSLWYSSTERKLLAYVDAVYVALLLSHRHVSCKGWSLGLMAAFAAVTRLCSRMLVLWPFADVGNLVMAQSQHCSREPDHWHPQSLPLPSCPPPPLPPRPVLSLTSSP